MIQVQTELFVADNTGAKKIECIIKNIAEPMPKIIK